MLHNTTRYRIFFVFFLISIFVGLISTGVIRSYPSSVGHILKIFAYSPITTYIETKTLKLFFDMDYLGFVDSVDYNKNIINIKRQDAYSFPDSRVFQIFFDNKTAVERAEIFTQNGIIYGIRNHIPSSAENIKIGQMVKIFSQIDGIKSRAVYILHGDILL